MASINFYAANGLEGPFDIDMAGSGLGFFGAGGFGRSVRVGEYQDNTYVTDGNGVVQGPQSNNVKWVDAGSGELPGDTVLNLLDVPNASATLNIQFTHATPVQVQNAELCIYDRNDTDAGPSGVTTKAYETLHPCVTQSGLLGSGDATWSTPAGSSVLEMAQSPGLSGLYAGDGSLSVHEDETHDWFACLSASPDSIGSKTQFGLHFAVEYL